MASQRLGETREAFLERHRLYLQRRRREQGIEARHVGRDMRKKRAADRAYQRRHPQRVRQADRRAKAKKPELYADHAWASKLRRKSRKANGVVEKVSRKGIVARDRGRCHLCGDPVVGEHFDHLIPLVRGGAYAMWNLMLAHELCNKRRGTKQILPEETKAAAEAYIAERIQEHAA